MAEKSAFTCATAAATSPVRSTSRMWPSGPARTQDVAVARDYKFMCSSLGQQMIEDDIKKEGSPGWSWARVRLICTRRPSAGPVPTPVQSVPLPDTNLREHVSWVHTDRVLATQKAKSLVAAAVGRVKQQLPLER